MKMAVFLSGRIPITQKGKSVGWQELSKAVDPPVIRKWRPQAGP